ncbi:MAG: GNAT family N-acetyltransferase [Chloroflexi bacterium]|nr:GNAT family N-acetyltransferase [Chloroflexota bacterium]
MSRDQLSIASDADDEQLAAAVDALVAAFAADPGWSVLLPDMRTRRSVLTAALSGLVADGAHRDSLLVALVDGGVVGAAIAWRPGYHPSPFRNPRYVIAAATILRAARLATVGLWRRWHAMRTADPRGEPHWHLAVLGVRPEAQHRGVGRALLGAFLERVDNARGATYLETSRPELVAWYGAVGFGVRQRLTLPGDTTAWTMWRSTSSAAPDAAPHLSPDEEVADRESKGERDWRQPLNGGGGRTIIG